MVITFDEQFLLTVSEDGCLLMWRIIDKEGRGLKSSRHIVHTEEILVTKSDLEEKVCVCVSALGPFYFHVSWTFMFHVMPCFPPYSASK